jgi:hypothetical protein
MQVRLAVLAITALLAACGDDATSPDAATVDATLADAPRDGADDATVDAAPPDATPDATPDAPIDAAPDALIDALPDALIDAAPDAPIDASTTAPVITDVVRADGGRQARQFSTIQIVVTGERLAGATAVTLGPLTATSVTASDTELRATVDIPHAFPPSSLALAITTAGGTTTHPDAITTTYWIVAPGASGGRGTYESPHGLCDEVLFGDYGDRFELLAGRHVAPCYVFAGNASIVGAGRDTTTVVDLAAIYMGAGAGRTVVLSDLTVEGDALGEPIVQASGDVGGMVVVRNVSFAGNRAVANNRGSWVGLTLDGVHYRGPGYGVEAENVIVISSSFAGCVVAVEASGTATVIGSSFEGCDTALLVRRRLEVRNATFTGCTTGIRTTGVPWVDDKPPIDIYDGVFLDTPRAVVVTTGMLHVEGTMFLDRRAEPTPPSFAIHVTHGNLLLRDSVIDTTGDGVRTLRDCEMVTWLDLADNVIDAGDVGVRHDACDSGYLAMRRNRVTGGNAAVDINVIDSLRSVHDLGLPGDPGGNELIVTSPAGYALIDRRNATEPDSNVTMYGSTLNGRSYAGQTVQGPAAVPPDYLITDEDIIEF